FLSIYLLIKNISLLILLSYCSFPLISLLNQINDYVMASVKFTSGLVAGLLLGLMFAPEKGQQTRKKVADAAGDLQDKINELFFSKKQDLDDLIDILENNTEEIDLATRQRLLRLVQDYEQRKGWWKHISPS